VKNRDGRLVLVAADTEKAYLASTGIDCNFINEQIEASYSQQTVLLLDCCYSGAFARGFKTRSGAPAEIDVAEPLSGRGRIVITASTALQFSHEVAGQPETELSSRRSEPSVFTAAVVEGLRSGAADLDGDGMISADELYEYVYRRVRDTVPQQTPTRSVSSVEGVVLLARNAQRSAAALKGQPEEDVDLLPFAGVVRGESEHSVMCVAFEVSLAYQGRRVVLSRAELFESLSSVAEDRSAGSIGYTMPTALGLLTRTGIGSDPPGRRFRAHTTVAKSLTDVVDQLRAGHPVLAGAIVRAAWQDPDTSRRGVLPPNTAQTATLGGMAVLVLGYRAAPPAFRVLTPWPSWGQVGLGWLPYETGLWDQAWGIEAFEEPSGVTP
jgi:hypothetical protein